MNSYPSTQATFTTFNRSDHHMWLAISALVWLSAAPFGCAAEVNMSTQQSDSKDVTLPLADETMAGAGDGADTSAGTPHQAIPARSQQGASTQHRTERRTEGRVESADSRENPDFSAFKRGPDGGEQPGQVAPQADSQAATPHRDRARAMGELTAVAADGKADPTDTPNDGTPSDGTPSAAPAGKAGSNQPTTPAPVSCQQPSDCPTVANGCIVMGCKLNPAGEGACFEKAFVCQCMPGQHSSCDDGDLCTIGACSAVGVCSFAANNPCDDGDYCTFDSCDTVKGCQHVPTGSCG